MNRVAVLYRQGGNVRIGREIPRGAGRIEKATQNRPVPLSWQDEGRVGLVNPLFQNTYCIAKRQGTREYASTRHKSDEAKD